MKDSLSTLTCSKCSHENTLDAVFCENCGQALERVCINCDTLNKAEAKFCRKCGTALTGISAEQDELRLSELQKSAPEGLQEKMRASSSEIEGERKPVTILFTDIVGSTAIAEKLDPEVWKEIVSGAHKRVGEAIYRYEGTIAQLLGDGVLAFFGAPITHEDDPIRAVRAALDIQESIKDYEHELEDLVKSFQMRVGINTGEVVIGNIGTDMHMEYLAIGDAVNIAERLQSAADPGKVLLSESSARLTGDAFELKSLGEISVKGKEEPVETFEFEGFKPSTEIGRRLQEYQTPFVGRETEVQALRSSLLKLCEGQGQVVSLIGEAGIGKTRLVEEVREVICKKDEALDATSTPTSSIRWLEGRALSYGGSLSYWTITQLLLSDLSLSDGASQVKIKVALRQRMNDLIGLDESDEVMPYIANLLGIALEGKDKEHIEALDGTTLKKNMHAALREYFSELAKENPTVLVLEDMHWADPSSLEALEGLLPLTDRDPLMILTLMRIERDHASWGIKIKAESDYPHRYQEFHLQRLSEGDSSDLLVQILGVSELPREIQHTIIDRSEGNPFYLEEVVRHLMERDLIIKDESGWHATEELEDVGIPDTLQGVLLARIDRLEEDVRHTLQMASVIGKSFLYRILETIADAEAQLDTHLSQLQRVDLIREKTRIPELEYMFKHAMTQEAAYNSLLHERRKVFHLKVGEALEELFPDRLEEFSGLMAYHFEAAEANEKAVDYLQRAGDQARLAYAHQEALDFYNRALAILKGQEEYDRAARTLMKIGLTYHTAFDFDKSRQAYDGAFSLRGQDFTNRLDTLEPASHPYKLAQQEPLTLDPTIANETTSISIIENIFSALVEHGTGWEIIPDVAKSWEISEDGRRYIFNLREDVFWSDGTQVTAEDFVYSWKRTLDPSTDASIGLAGLLYDIKNAEAFNKGEISDPNEVDVRAIDNLILEVNLEKPASYFLQVLPNLYPIPKHIVEDLGESWTDKENIVTNGAFQIVSYRRGETIALVRYPTYHGRFPGNIEKVEVLLTDSYYLPEGLKLYERQNLDVLPLLEATYHARHRYAEELVSYAEPFLYFVGFDTSRPPFNNLSVRQAFVMAVDRIKLGNELLDGFKHPATGGFIPPTIPGHSPGIGLPYDPVKARKLMAQAGYPDGQGFPPLEIAWDRSAMTTLEYLRSQWLDNLNVEVEIALLDWEDVLNTQNTRKIYYSGWTADYPDPDNFLIVAARYLPPQWHNNKYNQLLENAGRTLDQSDRIRLYMEADKILIEDVVIMPITYAASHFLLKPWVKVPLGIANLDLWKHIVIEPH